MNTPSKPDDIAVNATAVQSDPETIAQNQNAAFEMTMRGFNQALHDGDYMNAIEWARACARIVAISHDERHFSGTREAYAAIILGSAARFEALALHCGNIVNEHIEISRAMYGAANYLNELLKDGDKGIPAYIAASTLSYSSLLFQKTGEHQPFGTPTSAAYIQEVFALFDPTVEFAKGLMRAPANFAMSLDVKIASSATAMQNCGAELNWLLGSNWDKALWYSKRSLELLAIDPPADRPGPKEAPRRSALPRLQPAVDDLVKLIDALNEKNYRDSKRLLKNINNCFEQLLSGKR